MTGTDQKRAMLLTNLLVGEITVAQTATLMGLSERQVWRLKSAFERAGPAALVHGNRGRDAARVRGVAIDEAILSHLGQTTVGPLTIGSTVHEWGCSESSPPGRATSRTRGGVLVYRAIRSEGLFAFLRSDLVPLLISAVVANVFFKWGSFIFELVGFLALWFVLSLAADLVLNRRATAQVDKP